MTDIVERLRWSGQDAMTKNLSLGMAKLHAEAADEIERLREDLDEAVKTVRRWHRAALTMRDMSITGKVTEIELYYFNMAMSLPFFGADSEPLPSQRLPKEPVP